MKTLLASIITEHKLSTQYTTASKIFLAQNRNLEAYKAAQLAKQHTMKLARLIGELNSRRTS